MRRARFRSVGRPHDADHLLNFFGFSTGARGCLRDGRGALFAGLRLLPDSPLRGREGGMNLDFWGTSEIGEIVATK
jgi:hypothetical protein